MQTCTMEVHRGKDDRVKQVCGHAVDEGEVLVAQPPQDRSDPVSDELVEGEWSTGLPEMVLALLLEAGSNRKRGKLSPETVLPHTKASNRTSVLPQPLGMET